MLTWEVAAWVTSIPRGAAQYTRCGMYRVRIYTVPSTHDAEHQHLNGMPGPCFIAGLAFQ